MATNRFRVSPGTVIASLALLVSLGGTSYAVTVLPKNSVGTAQLRNNAVVATKVKDGSLLAADFKPGQLPAGQNGDKGDKGDKGDRGATGDAGASGATKVVSRRTDQTIGAGQFRQSTVSCASGERAVGGGAGSTSEGSGPSLFVQESKPDPIASGSTPTGWVAAAYLSLFSPTPTQSWSVWVICASP